jgi:hypothetical protein
MPLAGPKCSARLGPCVCKLAKMSPRYEATCLHEAETFAIEIVRIPLAR